VGSVTGGKAIGEERGGTMARSGEGAGVVRSRCGYV
jgi:hypothetical protein